MLLDLQLYCSWSHNLLFMKSAWGQLWNRLDVCMTIPRWWWQWWWWWRTVMCSEVFSFLSFLQGWWGCIGKWGWCPCRWLKRRRRTPQESGCISVSPSPADSRQPGTAEKETDFQHHTLRSSPEISHTDTKTPRTSTHDPTVTLWWTFRLKIIQCKSGFLWKRLSLISVTHQGVDQRSETSVKNLQNVGIIKGTEEPEHEQINSQNNQNAVTHCEIHTCLKHKHTHIIHHDSTHT